MSWVKPENNKERLLWLIPGAVLAVFISSGIFIQNSMLDGAEQELRMYQTALKAKDANEFNYSIKTHQGNVLTYGTFEAKEPAKFDEMNKTFSIVKRTEEEYTRKTREVCTTDSEGNESCHTETYYEWDFNGQEIKQSPIVKFMEREYPIGLFGFDYHRISAKDIVPGETEDEYYPVKHSGWFDSTDVGDLRYVYEIVPIKVSGSILTNTSNGTLAPAVGNVVHVVDQSVDDRVKSVADSVSTKNTVFTITWIILTVAAVAGAAYAVWERLKYVIS